MVLNEEIVMRVHHTDVVVAPGIYRSLSTVYNNAYKAKAETVVTVVERALPELKKLLVVSPGLHVRVAPIKARDTAGRCNSSNLIEIDCRLRWDLALEVLAHEMVHAEQYHAGKLEMVYSTRSGWVHYWEGTPFNEPKSYTKYRNLPWEKEAFGRQKELADTVHQILDKKYQ